MLNNLPQDIRSEKSSKSKFDLQLPRIQQASATATYNDSTVTGPTALRFHWLTLPRDYSYTSISEIDAQYTQLRKELLALNEQAAKTVQRMALKSKPQKQDGTHLIEVRGKQAENNAAIIGRLRAELQQLQKRVAVVSQIGKDSLQESIKQTKEQIIALRHKNKELQQKSKQIGCSIEAGDQAFSELKKLEVQVNLAQRKRAKLDFRWKETVSNLQKIGKGLSEVNDQAQQAENFIEEQIQSSRVDKAEKKFEYIYRQHIHNLQALRKNEESFNSLKQQKYHQCLKHLQEMCSRIQRTDKEIAKAGEKYIQQKEDLVKLEEKLKECIQNSNQRNISTVNAQYKEQEQKQNEKNLEQERFKHTTKVTRNGKMMKQDKNIQSQSTYGRISSEQEPSKTRLLNLRINKSVNRKNDKINKTIDVSIPIQKTTQLKKKKSTIQPKAERANLTNKSTVLPSLKVNTLDYTEKQSPKKEQFAVQKDRQQEYYFQDEHIEQQIQQSFINTYENKIKQKSDKEIEESDYNVKNLKVDQKSKPATPKHESKQQEKKQAQSQNQQQEDADLQQFKKSIAAELTGPYTGVGSINIALGQIQNSIKKHESKTRLHKQSKDDPIQQQDQQPLQ